MPGGNSVNALACFFLLSTHSLQPALKEELLLIRVCVPGNFLVSPQTWHSRMVVKTTHAYPGGKLAGSTRTSAPYTWPVHQTSCLPVWIGKKAWHFKRHRIQLIERKYSFSKPMSSPLCSLETLWPQTKDKKEYKREASLEAPKWDILATKEIGRALLPFAQQTRTLPVGAGRWCGQPWHPPLCQCRSRS